MKNRSYYELKNYKTFDERYEYLKLTGTVGEKTFGYDRYLNQVLYRSRRWQRTRDLVIIRDDGLDLGIDGYILKDKIIVHHINPITIEDIESERDIIFDIDYLICCSHNTHLAIHYGDKNLLPKNPIKRFSGDTSPWLINRR